MTRIVVTTKSFWKNLLRIVSSPPMILLCVISTFIALTLSVQTSARVTREANARAAAAEGLVAFIRDSQCDFYGPLALFADDPNLSPRALPIFQGAKKFTVKVGCTPDPSDGK